MDINWSLQENPIDNAWTSVCYGDGLYVKDMIERAIKNRKSCVA